MEKLFPRNLLLGLGLCCLFLSACQKENLPLESAIDLAEYDLVLKKQFKNYEIFQLDYDQIYALVEDNIATGFKLNLNIPGYEHWDFQCVEDDFKQYFHPDYKYYHVDKGQLIEQELPKVVAIEGFNNRSTRSSFMTFALGRLEANIFDGEQEYQIDPLFNFSEKAPKNWYVLYKPADVIWEAVNCSLQEESIEAESPIASARSTNCKVVEVTYLGDYELLSKWSSNQWVEAANWKSQRLYWANKRFYPYNSQALMLQHKAGYQNVSASDAQPNTNYNNTTFLNECKDLYDLWWWNEGDVNHVWTGQYVAGVYGRAAGIGKMCDPEEAFCYAEYLSGNYQANNLTAHEMGHLMGSHHDNSSNNVMHKDWPNVTSTLGSNAKNNLTNHMNANASCFWTQTCQ